MGTEMSKEHFMHSKETPLDLNSDKGVQGITEGDVKTCESPNVRAEFRTCDSDTFAAVGEIHNEGKYEIVLLLFSFVDVEPDAKLNELLAGYFKTAAVTLMEGKGKEMVKFFEDNPQVLDNLFMHSINDSIAAVFCKAMSLEDNTAEYFGQLRKNMLTKLLDRLENPSLNCHSVQRLSKTFCEVAEEWKDLAATCCTEETLAKLLELALNKARPISMAGITILVQLLSKESFSTFFEKRLRGSMFGKGPKNEKTSVSIREQLAMFREVLLEDYEPVNNQARARPFGEYRLKIVEYIYYLIKLTLFSAIDGMYQLQYPKLLLNLFPRFPFNSLLHSQLYKIFKTILDSNCKSLVRIVLSNNLP
eukprot:TRINITY_DN5939_c0_g2_i1.p1 TRINITY_DN5939_c0_g2~~TRINITY_DN5939_c0_g2_i1.p1  ORF type:complete len:362 (+),score=43.52 TRINITY_DN5939_c0_g2_i1:82-1167(+)